jgi:hypothetical protein
MFETIQTSDWVLIGSTIILAVTALIAPHVYDFIKRKLYAPELEIEFSHEPPYSHKTVRKAPKVGNKTMIVTDATIDYPVYYCRFGVHNKGKSQAKLCEAVLEEIGIADSSGTFHKDENFSPVNLNWVGFKGQPYININPDRRVFCDIGHLSSPEYQRYFEFSHYALMSEEDQKKHKFFFDLLIYFYAQRDSLVPGNYKIKVAIYSENAPKCEKMFQITWSGKWKDTEKEMFRELVIKCL